MDSQHASPISDDLSALAWVHEEVRKSLDSAHKALHRCLKEAVSASASDVDALDPAILRTARQQIHQGVGALELAGLPAGAMLLRASEAAVQRFVTRPQSLNEGAVKTIEAASFALLDLMRRRLAGKRVSSLALFPQYEALLALSGTEMPRPSDLWAQEWPAMSLDVPMAPPASVEPHPVDEQAVSAFEAALLQLLRGARPEQARPLVRLCAELAADASARQAHRESATWLLACGFLEAIADERLPLTVHVKRVLAGLLRQLRTLARNPGLPSDRLAQELLFFCAQAAGKAGTPQPSGHGVLDQLRSAFKLDSHQPVDLSQSALGRFDPAWVAQAAKRVSSAKDGWSAVAAGELLRLTGLNEQFSLVGDSLRRLYPDGEPLAQALTDSAAATVQSGAVPPAPLAMEVATSLLYVEASLDEAEFEHPDERQRVRRLAERIQAVRSGQAPEPLEPWMEALYRHVSDRQTIGSVVQELRSTLGECEKRIDQFFRDHQNTASLVEVPSQLQSMKGVLAVLGLDSAAQAVSRMRSDVDQLLVPGVDLEEAARGGVHDRLATNLGAVGFLVDMLAVQPSLAKTLFVFNDDSGVLAPIMGRAVEPTVAQADPVEVIARPAEEQQRARALEAAEALAQTVVQEDVPLDTLTGELLELSETPLVQEQPELAASIANVQAAFDHAVSVEDAGAPQQQAREDLAAALTDFAEVVSSPMPLDMPDEAEAVELPPAAPLVPEQPAAPEATGLEEDDEMRGIFIEEAREVIGDARDATDGLRSQPDDLGLLTTVRRAFHTLKGSSRMVGLGEFGEAAWACEQLYNAWLASQAPASEDLLGLTGEALDHLAEWVDAIERRQAQGYHPRPLVQAADALRLEGRRVPLAEADAQVAEPAPAHALPAEQAAVVVPAPQMPDVADLALPLLDTTAEVDGGEATALLKDGTPPAIAEAPDWLPLPEATEVVEPAAALPDLDGLDATDEAGAASEHDDELPTVLDLSAPDLLHGAQDVAAADDVALPAGDDVDLIVLDLKDDEPAPAHAEVPTLTLDAHEGTTEEAEDTQPAALDAAVADAEASADLSSMLAFHALPVEVPAAPAGGAPALGDEAAPVADAAAAGQADALDLDLADANALGDALPSAVEVVELEADAALPDGGSASAEGQAATHASDAQEQADAPASPPVDAHEAGDEVIGQEGDGDDQVKVIGPLRISIPLFNIYLNEADEQSRRLSVMLGEWALEWHRPVSEDAVALAHSLAGNSGTVGYTELSQLARLLEHSLVKARALNLGDEPTAGLFNEAAEEIRRLLHQFAAGFLKSPNADLMARLSDFELRDPARPAEARSHLRLVHSADEAPQGQDATASVDAAKSADGGQALEGAEAAEGASAPTTTEAEAIADAEPATDPVASHSAPDVDITELPAPDAAAEADHAASQPMPLGLPEVRPFEPLASVPELTLSAQAADEVDLGEDADIDVVDAIDADLFPIFEEEALELLPQLAADVRQWVAQPARREAAVACMRTLHTFKGGARLAGAMRLGELAHRMESAIERLLASEHLTREEIEPLQARSDVLSEVFESVQRRDRRTQDEQAAREAALALAEQAVPEPVHVLPSQSVRPASAEDETLAAADLSAPDLDLTGAHEALEAADEAGAQATPQEQDAEARPGAARRAGAALQPIDWSRVSSEFSPSQSAAQTAEGSGAGMATVRVRPRLLDRLVNHAGEVTIARTRLAAQVQQMRASVGDLTDNLERLRVQLRDLELQAETQLSTRMEATRAQQQQFDPLEFDRYTRFQEVTRMMAESVNDVATVQRALIRNLESAEDQLAAQARLTRDLQDDLLRTRMVEFETLSDRLYRVVRQAAKETGKQVRLDIAGGHTEVDRGVLERMTGAFEHLLRNSVTHGVEPSADRQAAGKDPAGTILVAVRQEGNEVSIEFRDDGAGLNLERIRRKAESLGLLAPGQEAGEAELAQMIFTPGFSTAESVTELAGRGIGMDVVRAEVNAMGGRIETASAAGQGTSFKLVLPLTTAVTKVVMVRCGDLVVSIPTNLVEVVRRSRAEDVEKAYVAGTMPYADLTLPFFWFGALLQHSARGAAEGRSLPVVVVRSAQQRVALHVDEVLGNQDVVVKNLGPQLSRVPGLAGMTLLASGAVALIYNPVALATVYGADAQGWARQALQQAAPEQAGGQSAASGQAPAVVAPVAASPSAAPLVLVVDDSLTVRRVTQRLLTREGYRVTLAKDGLEALEKLAEELPLVVLSDIEMPRMDGFDLVRNIRGDERWRGLPVIMITSRIAQKHRDYATELGVDHYLGKPYSEEELVGLVARYTRAAATASGGPEDT